jgi:transglutaminase-like putative cysteine protease
MKPAPGTELLPRGLLLHLLAVLGVVLAPHLPRLPWWESSLVAAVASWRVLAMLRAWRPPSATLRVLLAVAALLGVYGSYGRVSGQVAGVALLVAMAALKLTELKTRRDVLVMVLLMYFVLLTHFLFSQEPWTVAYLLGCAWLVTALLVEANHGVSSLAPPVALRRSAALIAQALPLMVLLFVLFPRIPGPLWGLPADAGAARSGLSDSMAPGDFDRLIESDEVSFRVRFDGAAPPMRERYWRGPVLGHFDGRRWTVGSRPWNGAPPFVRRAGPAYRYEITLEPQRSRWLFALDLPDPAALPSDAVLDVDGLLLARAPVRSRRAYRLVSYPHDRLQPQLPDALAKVFLQLPPGYNPRTLALARRWRAQGLDGQALIAAALAMFREQNFVYSLHPPVLGRNGIDEFLFDTRRGFCEHYAAAFTVLMRAAGLPARVVTGYQGGEKNEFGDYYVVRQSDAHAWSEVWLPEAGWVRVDPTAAVAPSRIEDGLGAALRGTGELPAFLDPSRRGYRWRYALAARWDWINAQWNHWVLGYGPELQQDFMRRLGLIDWTRMILALTLSTTALLAALGALLLREYTPRRERDPALHEWRRIQRPLARAGLAQRASEGPHDFARRVAAARPDLADAMEGALALYLQQRYLRPPDAKRQRALRRAVSDFLGAFKAGRGFPTGRGTAA